jgi:hypothetical protein
MSYAQRQEGLRLLREMAGDLVVGEWDHDRHSVRLHHGDRLVARVSQEVLEDWPATPGITGIVEQGLRMAREEFRAAAGTPRVVTITTTGSRFE